MTRITRLEIEFLPPYNLKILDNLVTLKLLAEDYAFSICKLLLEYKKLYATKKLRPTVNPFYGAHILLDSLFLLIGNFLVDDTQQKISYEKLNICKQSFDLVFLNYGYIRQHSKPEIIANVNTAIARIFYVSVQDLIEQT